MGVNIAKKAAGYKAAEFVQSGMRIGIGTGSTVYYFIERLAARCSEGLKIEAIATSKASYELAHNLKIPMLSDQELTALDLTVDGADEIDSKKQMIKGGGGALLFEKIVASSSDEMVVIIDREKVSSHLGNAKLPIEIIPFGYKATLRKIEALGHSGILRQGKDSALYMTDGGHLIYDIALKEPLHNASALHTQLITVPGVVETGLFYDIAGRVVIGDQSGETEVWS